MKGSKGLWALGGLLLVAVVVIGMPFAYTRFMQPNYKYGPMNTGDNNTGNYGPGMTGDNGLQSDYGPGMMGNNGTGNGYGPGMMGQWGNGYKSSQNENGERMTVQEVKEAVERYLENYNESLEIGDIFVYTDTDYYVSIEETDTGKGAMELLVNPYTGGVYPETGPNMMWNEKYNMMGNSFSGNTQKRVSRNEAVEIADKYVKESLNSQYTVSNEGHEFYGYYTFHVNQGDQTVGMLSVNYGTGDVWYHTWHGQLEEVISHHED